MGAAEVISIEDVRARKQWDTLRQQLHERGPAQGTQDTCGKKFPPIWK
jgi:hypothetical protein